jgi:hypothetical protein
VHGTYLVVSDINRARADLVSKGIEVSEIFTAQSRDKWAADSVVQGFGTAVTTQTTPPAFLTQQVVAGCTARRPGA